METKMMKDWERSIRQLGEHWTGSPAEMTQARIAVCEMCAGYYVKGDGLFKANLQEDVRQEMAVLMLEKLEKFDPGRVSLQDKAGKRTDNALLKYVLSEAGHCYSDAVGKILENYNMDGGESMRSLPEKQRNLHAVRLDQLISNETDDQPTDWSSRVASPRDDVALTDGSSLAQSALCAVAGVILNFRNSSRKGGKKTTEGRFLPLCFSEHMTFITENDRACMLLSQKLLARYHKDVRNALDWDYLRFFADGLPEQPDSLHSLYNARLKKERDVFPGGKDKPLCFRSDSFFLPAKVPLTYYDRVYGEAESAKFVTINRQKYTALLLRLRAE